MFFSDFRFIALWWFVNLLFSLAALPLTFVLFPRFWDKGYAFSKTIGIALTSFLILVFGVFRLVPFTSVSIVILLLFIFLLGTFFLQKQKQNFIELLTETKSAIIAEEIIYLFILTLWSYVRGFSPDIEGLEKFMDWGFVNSALRSHYLPPLDMWFSGEIINYYYFGHLATAVVAKLSSISSAIVYNLAIASTCAATFVSVLSLVSNLIFSPKSKNFRYAIVGAVFSSLLLTFGGNLHPLYKIGKTIISNEGKLTLSREAITKAAGSYWYPDATRFIGFDPDVQDKTIHEFPVYSFVVADLHGHMNDIPNVLLFLALLISLLPTVSAGLSWTLVIPLGFVLSVAYMTNAWDFAVYGLCYAIFSFFYYWYHQDLRRSLITSLVNGLMTIVVWYLFTLPFSLNFTPMAEGLRLSDSHTPFYQLFVLYGGFWLIAVPLVVSFFADLFRRRLQLSPSDIFVLSLIVSATILIVLPEIGYIKDIYIYEHRRANTMFKLVYQAFILYSLASGYILIHFRKNNPVKILIILVAICHLIYPYFAIKSYYGLKDYKGLWGLGFLSNSYPDNLKAINWLNQNVSGQPVILEAVGDSYTTFGQVSVATGLPTVEGWIVHEWLWRGGYDQPAARQTDVQQIYEATSPELAQSLLQKYSVKYVFIGDKEREKYPALNEKIFTALGAKVVFESGNTRVYQL